MESVPWADLNARPLATARRLVIETLNQVLQTSEDAYYNHGNSALSDKSYDIIKDYFDQQQDAVRVEKNNIGAPVDSSPSSNRKCKLPIFMGSLNKITEAQPSVLKTFMSKYHDEYVVSDKLDGNSALLILQRNDAAGGIRPHMFTRGNGFEGLDISHIVSSVLDVGAVLSKAAFSKIQNIIIRGEVILTRDAFLNTLRHKGTTARNMIAGMLNSKVPDPEILAASEFIAYELIEPVMQPADQINFLKSFGVRCVHSEMWSSDRLTFAQLQQQLRTRTRASEYEIDGLVVMHNAVHAREAGENPRHAFAFKDGEALQREHVTVRSVEWKLSKDGRYVPTVHFDAVTIDNVSIQRATGFNAKFVVDHGIGPGARAVIVRAGAVIPHIAQVLSASPRGPQLPDGFARGVTWSQSGVDLLMHPDDTESRAILAKKLLHHFFDKIGVMGLGPALVERLYDAGFENADAVVRATQEDLCKVPGVKATLARKLQISIEASVSQLTVSRFMEASNAFGRGFGSKKLDIFLAHMASDHVPTEDELCSVKGVDTTTARAFLGGLRRFNAFCESNPFLWARLRDSRAVVEQMQDARVKNPSHSDSRYYYVFSGFRDRDLEARLMSTCKIEFGNSVTRGTTAVVVSAISEKDTAKTRRARELGVPIIDLHHFLSRHGARAGA